MEVAVAWFKVRTKEPTWKSHGGDLVTTLQGNAGGAYQASAAIVEAEVTDIMLQAQARWPIGPDRGKPPRPHSITLFQLERSGGGWFASFTIVNTADYLRYIYRPGQKHRLVAEEEILSPLRAALPRIRAAVAAAIRAAYTGP